MQKKQIEKTITSQMKALGIYRQEYSTVIEIFAGMVSQYQAFVKDFESQGGKIEEEYTNKAGATNMRKTPTYSAMEKMRMDIATYSNLLCLNPKSLETVTAESQGKSKLAEALSNLEK